MVRSLTSSDSFKAASEEPTLAGRVAPKSGKTFGHDGIYEVKAFNYGLILPGEGMTGEIGNRYDAVPLSALPAREITGPGLEDH